MFLMVEIDGFFERISDMAALSTAQTVMVVRRLISPARWVRVR